MIIVKGRAVCGGIAEGRLRVYEKAGQRHKEKNTISSVDSAAEMACYRQAKTEAVSQLELLYQRTRKEAGEKEAAIFKAHQLLVEDPNYEETVCRYIKNRQMTAVEAVETAGETIAQALASLSDSYMRERAADVRDVARRLTRILSDTASEKKEQIKKGESVSFILLAEDLTPSETIQMDRSQISAFVTRRGSEKSHTAILARTLGIPAIVGAEWIKEAESAEISSENSFPVSWNGLSAILDGEEGTLYIEPDAKTRACLQVRLSEEENNRKRLQTLKGKENRTQDGRTIELYANIGSVEDAEVAIRQDAGGIGLFRTEFLYLGETDYPTEETQFMAYRTVAERFAGKPVVIRTLDIGADKQAEYFNLEPEENPAMGYRAIRICLEQKELFRTQLRAIYRASHYGSVRILVPMITAVEEVQETKAQLEEIKQELDQERLPYGKVKLGVMIETPAAAIISDLLAKEVDFFSIGTNDLIQYTLAVDRQNPRLERFYQPYHESVLRLIRLVAENAHQAGIPVGICGELAADLSLTEEWLRLGVEELSVAPPMILPVREQVRRCR